MSSLSNSGYFYKGIVDKTIEPGAAEPKELINIGYKKAASGRRTWRGKNTRYTNDYDWVHLNPFFNRDVSAQRGRGKSGKK